MQSFSSSENVAVGLILLPLLVENGEREPDSLRASTALAARYHSSKPSVLPEALGNPQARLPTCERLPGALTRAGAGLPTPDS
ncbi:hypothetical protein M0804_000871 [Polistes exclamans]|nr:hypothetical protein M0804_000871 [Polistes exclamans]